MDPSKRLTLKKAVRLLFTFYQSHFFAALMVTFCCLYIYSMYGMEVFAVLFWFKVLTLALIYFFIKKYKNKEFYYYQNLGVSKLALWVTSLCFDLILFIILLIIVHKLK
jgi:hypothetical protein